MTAKEKAIELYEFFEGYPLTIDWVKQCAIKCVDEIIESNPMEDFGCSDSGTEYRSTDEFWQEVKEEIEKL